jgi:DNA-binding winged helix-turn-helix (wHTH) protein
MALQFDEFVIDPATRRLLKHDCEVHLSPKAFDLLGLLIAHRDRAVQKAEIHEALWPETFVLETNLPGLIAEIRRGLDDSANAPRYVRTVSRFGYWFIGKIREEGPGPALERARARCWLIWDRRRMALSEGDNLVGRDPDAAVWIEAPGVSRRHALIRVGVPEATIEDLGSKNGTFVRGTRVTGSARLGDGDEIRLGSVVLIFRIPPPAGSTESTS